MLYLIRHGESAWNAAGTVQGSRSEPPLTGRGRGQAETAARALAERLSREARVPDRLLCSDLRRAVESAAEFSSVLGITASPRSRLRERNLGRFEGGPAAVLADEIDSQSWTDPDLAIGGGESGRDVYHRMVAELAPWIASAQTTIVVSHGLAIHSFVVGYDILPPTTPTLGFGAMIRIDDDGRGERLAAS